MHLRSHGFALCFPDLDVMVWSGENKDGKGNFPALITDWIVIPCGGSPADEAVTGDPVSEGKESDKHQRGHWLRDCLFHCFRARAAVNQQKII